MKVRGLVLSGVALALSACASVGQHQPDPLQLRLSALESQSQTLRDSVADQGRMLSGLGAVGLGSTVSTLEEQFRTLRGQIEELQYKIKQQDERQRALYLDMDRRLQTLESGGSSAAGSRPSGSGQVDSDADQKAYLDAFQSLRSGDYDKSVAGFTAFLTQFPESPYAPNAQYWIGEARYVKREFQLAWDAFALVLQRFPSSAKAADALLKQGLLRVEQGQQDQAKALLKDVVSRYPSSSAANLAKERLQQMGVQ
jgi:tol-pal system protein YbgF